ncbi:uncharacterized protein LOC130940050 [Arachis stenosperma]|uniref:uncharacterized protein LOC130940050 n=1 Tax=Arachis stenosperma TaxID=217475 RepID=UPI0025ABE970|nr:uncharacterized protein LOC130940050 [Arachis stenosperma]
MASKSKDEKCRGYCYVPELELLPAPTGLPAAMSSPLSSAMRSGSTSSSSSSSSNASPIPVGVLHCKEVDTLSTIPISPPPLQLRSTAKDGEATCSSRGAFTGTHEDTPTGLKLELATVPIVWVFRFEPPELDTTSTNFTNSSGVLTSENCRRQWKRTYKSSSLPMMKQSYFTSSRSTEIGMRYNNFFTRFTPCSPNFCISRFDVLVKVVGREGGNVECGPIVNAIAKTVLDGADSGAGSDPKRPGWGTKNLGIGLLGKKIAVTSEACARPGDGAAVLIHSE